MNAPFSTELLDYCRRNFIVDTDGFLYRVAAHGNPCEKRKMGGYVNKRGYPEMTFCWGGKMMKALVHRITVLVATGEWPEEVDHIDGNRLNNNLSNLRGCTRQQNARNNPTHKTNKNGFPVGVCQRAQDGKFIASIQIDRKTRIWAFWKLEDAIQFRKMKEREIYGEFARQP